MSSHPAFGGREDASRADRKRAAILEAAREAFFANGFVGTSMDQVAARAAVSKQTVYKHFRDKDTLFREVVINVVRVGEGGIPSDIFLEGEGSIEERLRSFSRSFLRGVMQPDVLSLRRLVIGEAGRFPELGRAFYELGPGRATEQLAIALGETAARHNLMINDHDVAAGHLLSLILSRPLDEALLLGDEFHFTEGSLNQIADEAVAAFLQMYVHPDG
jgi:TetR/AcrR family transcriptional repressor of mexJK operon